MTTQNVLKIEIFGDVWGAHAKITEQNLHVLSEQLPMERL